MTTRIKSDPAPSQALVFILAFLGGVAPSMITVARILQEQAVNPDTQMPNVTLYLLGSLIYGVIGGVLVLASRETSLPKAFSLGIAAPSIIIASTQNLSDPGKKSAPAAPAALTAPADAEVPRGPLGFVFFPSLGAQDVPAPPPAPLPSSVLVGVARSVEIFSYNKADALTLQFLDNAGGVALGVDIPPGSQTRVLAPEQATAARFVLGDALSGNYPLLATRDQQFEVETDRQLQYGLMSAFGQAPAMKVNFTVKGKAKQRIPVGQTGWCLVGRWGNGRWGDATLDVKDGPDKLTGVVCPVTGSVNLRETAGPGARLLGTLLLSQKVTVLETKSLPDGAVWGRVRVED